MTTEYKIDKKTPFPIRARDKYPFRDMQVGDCFTFSVIQRNTVTNAALQYGKRFGAKFTTRREGDLVRIWRTA